MQRIELPFFGNIEPSSEGYWEVAIPYCGAQMELDLNVDGEPFPETAARALIRRVEDVAILDGESRKAMLEAHARGSSAVTEYHAHHLEDCAEAELSRFFGSEERSSWTAPAMVERLKLLRIGLYPDEPEQLAIVLDYSMGAHFTDFVIAVKYEAGGRLTDIAMER